MADNCNTVADALSSVHIDQRFEEDLLTHKTSPESPSKSDIKTAAIIKTFPLPRQLRDEIYSYLLNGTKVKRASMSGSLAYFRTNRKAGEGILTHEYKFSTAILRVNKSIGFEAKEYFLKQNTFIQISYNMPGLIPLMYRFDIPFIARSIRGETNSKLSRASLQPSVDVMLNWKCQLPGLKQTLSASRDRAGELIILTEQWPAFCSLLRFLAQWSISPAVYIGSQMGVQQRLITKAASSAATLAINLRSTEAKPVNIKDQSAILDTLATITAIGDHLTITGFSDVKRAQSIVNAASCSLIWLRALTWDRLDDLTMLKQHADDLALDERLKPAKARYNFLFDPVMDNVPNEFSVPRHGQDPVRLDAEMRTAFLLVEMRMSLTAVLLRLGEYGAADDSRRAVRKSKRARRLHSSSRAAYKHMKVLAEYLAGYRDEENEGKSVDDARYCLKMLEKLPQDDYVKHDCEVLREDIRWHEEWYLDPMRSPPEEFTLDIKSLSISVAPLRTFNSHTKFGGAPRPRSLVGWQDTEHLARLTEGEKVAIQQLQREKGYRITMFE